MKHAVGTIALCACLAGFAGENLLKNGDFEAGNAKGWGNWTSEARVRVLKEGAHGGTRCLEYAVDSEKGGYTVHSVPVVSNRTYTVSGWVMGDAGVLEIRIFYRDAQGKWLAESSAFKATKLTEWTHFAKAFTPSAKCASVQVGVHAARGVIRVDDLCVEEGNQVGEAPNEIPNSAFGYALHEDGLPELWNTGGYYSFNALQPGVHEGKFYRMVPEETPPVAGARVLWQRGIGFSWWRTGPLAGDSDYVLSIYAKSEKPGAKMGLSFGGKSQTYALSNVWQRLVLKSHLKNGVEHGSPKFDFYGDPVYLSAPMLHAGSEPLAWKPSPLDANFADLKGGTQTPPKKAGVSQLDVPESADWSGAAKLTDFHPLKALSETESAKFRAFVRRNAGALLVAIEADTGRKPSVAVKKGNPLVIGNDAAELFLSSSESGAPYVQFMGGRNGASAATYGSQGDAFKAGWRYAARETAKGWRAEYAIPLDLLPKPDGTCWRLNVGVTEFVGPKAVYYSATRDGFHAARSYLRLTGLPRGGKAVKPPRAAAEYDACLMEKTLRVRIENVEGPATLRLNGVRKTVDATSSSRLVTFDISTLPEGCHEIELTAANGTAKTYFRKFAAGESFSRVNRFKQQLEIDGKPFFPMVYSWCGKGGKLPTAWQIDELKRHNFNTIMPMPELYKIYAKPDAPQYRCAVMKAFADAGFKFLVWAPTGELTKRGIPALVEQRKLYIDEFAAFKKDIVGWYYVDEIGPFWEKTWGIKIADYAKGYRAMKDYDAGRLHFINWNWTGLSEGQPWYGEKDATDLYSLDCYAYSTDLYSYGALTKFERGMQLLHGRIRETSLPGIVWLQTYSYQEGTREPMPVEYRNNVCIALINRASGLMNFIGCPDHKDLWDEMGRDYGFALKFLAMTARPGAEMIAKGKQGSVSYALWKDGAGGYALVAANTLYAKQEEKVEVKGRGQGWGGGRVELIGGEGELKIGKDGSLEIDLPTAGSAVWFLK